MTYGNAFAALADVRRREIVERLAEQPLSVGALATHFPISRPAISQHLKILSDAGLVHVQKVGARRIYALDNTGIGHMRAYLDRLWDDALASYTRAAHALSEEDAS